MPNVPDVSVIIAAWNARSTLPRAIESVLAQKTATCEVIVIDDASTDDTLACAQSFADKHQNVLALANPVNGGPAVARNLGLSQASGTYVTVLDSDDFLEPDRLSRLIESAKANEADFLADDLLRVIESNLEGERSRLLGDQTIGLQQIDLEQFILGNLTTANGSRGEMGFLKPLMSRQFLNQHKICYDENMRLGEDYMLYAEALAKGARFFLTDPMGYVAVMRADSLSGRHSAKDLGALVAADLAIKERYDLSETAARALQQHLIDTKKRWQWMRLIEAVKAKDIPTCLKCFTDTPAVSLHLLGQLAQQLFLRTGRKVGLLNG